MTPPLPSIRRLLAVAVFSAAYVGCGDPVDAPVDPCASPAGTWILAARDAVFGERVLILQVVSDSAAAVTEVPSRAADGTVGVALDTANLTSSASCGSINVAAQLATTSLDVWLNLSVVGDTAKGTVVTPQHTSPLFGLRIDPAILASADSFPAQAAVDSTPVLVLRFDDALATDSSYLRRLIARGLVGEEAVITQLVGRSGFDTWADIGVHAHAGFGIVAHSRRHTGATDPWFGFMVEVIGSLVDLRERGYVANVFVQPGTWHDTLNFDSPAKLANWRGALFRNVVQVFEGYEGGWAIPTGRIGRVPLGVHHSTLTSMDSSTVQAVFRQVMTPSSFTVFLIHTIDVKPLEKYDWLLDSLVSAVKRGRVRLASTTTAVLGPQGETGP